MLYVSIAIILIGTVILVSSLLLDARRDDTRDNATDSTRPSRAEKPLSRKESRSSAHETAQQIDTLFPEDNVSKTPSRAENPPPDVPDTRKRDAAQKTENTAAPGSAQQETSSTVPASSPDNGPDNADDASAVLYHDASGIIDYSRETGNIDASLESYKNIRRIGEGSIALAQGGINFYQGKRLFRYDFHKIQDIKTGGSYLALFPTDGKSVKLFVFKNASTLILKINNNYLEYKRVSE